MKISLSILSLAFVLASNGALADSKAPLCVGIEIGAHYQVMPVDGTPTVAGSLPTADLAGFNTNPLVAEAKGTAVAFNEYEVSRPSMLGQFLGTYMTAQSATTQAVDGTLSCDLQVEGSLGKHKLTVIATSARGDIILKNYDAADPMSFLVIKKLNK